MFNVNRSAVYLAKLGFYPQHNGFGYLAYAMTVFASDPMGYYSGGVDLVARVAADFGVSAVCVRRCMSYSIHSAWEMPANSALRAIFPGSSADYPPSLHEFICRAAIDLGLRPEVQ